MNCLCHCISQINHRFIRYLMAYEAKNRFAEKNWWRWRRWRDAPTYSDEEKWTNKKETTTSTRKLFSMRKNEEKRRSTPQSKSSIFCHCQSMFLPVEDLWQFKWAMPCWRNDKWIGHKQVWNIWAKNVHITKISWIYRPCAHNSSFLFVQNETQSENGIC